MAPDEEHFEPHEDDAFSAIYWRDEILQLMYWLKGEGLLEEVAPDDLRRFLEAAPERLSELLAQLVQDGYLELGEGDTPRYRLSILGLAEGRRRFADEFAALLGRESHIVCGDPECDCQTSGETCTRLPDGQGAP
jgi:hypothetical protein